MAAAQLGRKRRSAQERVRLEVVDSTRAFSDSFAVDKSRDRREFLQKALVIGGVIAASGIVVAGLPRLATSAPSPAQDVEVANFVLLLEYLQAAFYDEASKEGLGSELSAFVSAAREHEQVHVAFLKDFLGAAASSPPVFDFQGAFDNAASLAATAVTIEDLGVAAYNGQAGNLTPAALQAAAQIVSVDARHAAWIRAIVGKPPAPNATDTPESQSQVMQSLEQRGFVPS